MALVGPVHRNRAQDQELFMAAINENAATRHNFVAHLSTCPLSGAVSGIFSKLRAR
jgi:hypothetical protein